MGGKREGTNPFEFPSRRVLATSSQLLSARSGSMFASSPCSQLQPGASQSAQWRVATCRRSEPSQLVSLPSRKHLGPPDTSTTHRVQQRCGMDRYDKVARRPDTRKPSLYEGRSNNEEQTENDNHAISSKTNAPLAL